MSDNDDDDFQIHLTQTITRRPLKPSNSSNRVSKKPKRSGKENAPGPTSSAPVLKSQSHTPPSRTVPDAPPKIKEHNNGDSSGWDCDGEMGLLTKSRGCLSNSIESRLMAGRVDLGFSEDFEVGAELDVLLKLCSQVEGEEDADAVSPQHGDDLRGDQVFAQIQCPLCGIDISHMSSEERQLHTNECLDKEETQAGEVSCLWFFFFFFFFWGKKSSIEQEQWES
jgi:DNA cross-link repair 1A protein